MRKIALFFCVLAFIGCNRKVKEKIKDQVLGRFEIAPFKVTKMLLRDTTQLKTLYSQTDSGRVRVSDYVELMDEMLYLNKKDFRNFENAVWKIVHQPGSHVYIDGDKPATLDELRSRVVLCDSVRMSAFDANGDEVVSTVFACDSVTKVRNINMIRFAEAWYFNPANNMIERETLGYSLYEWVPDKQGFRNLFQVYPNQEAYKKAKENDFW
jgi:hypothetical protein